MPRQSCNGLRSSVFFTRLKLSGRYKTQGERRKRRRLRNNRKNELRYLKIADDDILIFCLYLSLFVLTSSSQERATRASTLASNTVRLVIDQSGTTLTFSEDIGLPDIFKPITCRYMQESEYKYSI